MKTVRGEWGKKTSNMRSERSREKQWRVVRRRGKWSHRERRKHGKREESNRYERKIIKMEKRAKG